MAPAKRPSRAMLYTLRSLKRRSSATSFNGQKYGGGGIIAMFTIDGPDWLLIAPPIYLLVAWAAGRQVTTPSDRYSKGLPAKGAPHDG
jgi:hypothetical protein